MMKLLPAVLKLLPAVLKLLPAVLKLLPAVLKLLPAVLKLLPAKTWLLIAGTPPLPRPLVSPRASPPQIGGCAPSYRGWSKRSRWGLGVGGGARPPGPRPR